jgi:phytoene dehydrogenase-like protein
MITTRFEHPTVRSAIYSLVAGATPAAVEGSAMGAAFISFIHDTGAMRPVGGMQALPDALCRCLSEAGGTVLTNAIVTSIDVESGRAAGVVLEDGRAIRARVAVVAACDVHQTIGTLLPDGAIDTETRRSIIAAPANAYGNAWVKIDLAFSGRLRLARHERWRGDGLDLRRPAIMIGEMPKVARAYGLNTAGLVPSADSLLQWAFVATGVDPSQAPEGMDTLYLSTPTMPLDPTEGWGPELTELAAHAMLKQAEVYYDGLDQELGHVVETPPDLVSRLRTSNGCYFHVDFTPFRSAPLRPALGLGGYSTPVTGLYLSGAGTHPGGGVGGLPGRLAAQRVLRDHAKRLRRTAGSLRRATSKYPE